MSEEWKKCIVGKIERGLTWSYDGMDVFDTPDENSFLWYGTVWITGIDDIELIYKTFQAQIVDIADENTVCLRLDVEHRMLINKGLTPCIFSTAERLPDIDWFHFAMKDDRALAFGKLNEIYGKLGKNAKMYLVLNLFPLKLVYFMKNEEMQKQEKDELLKVVNNEKKKRKNNE